MYQPSIHLFPARNPYSSGQYSHNLITSCTESRRASIMQRSAAAPGFTTSMMHRTRKSRLCAHASRLTPALDHKGYFCVCQVDGGHRRRASFIICYCVGCTNRLYPLTYRNHFGRTSSRSPASISISASQDVRAVPSHVCLLSTIQIRLYGAQPSLCESRSLRWKRRRSLRANFPGPPVTLFDEC